ncbi:MAG TPA: hypothetical protein VFQ70_03040 [Candidatus Saccharimonadaceae bacterium]|nr:hypothetical protein [Candidatus Saccharimonadaceae bacterium]
MIHSCDAVIAEVTNPSLGVGYELTYAENLGKPVLCLFDTGSGKKLSAMIAGNSHFQRLDYTADTIPEAALNDFLNTPRTTEI